MRQLPLHPFSLGNIFELAGGLLNRRWLTFYSAAALFLVPGYAVMDLAASTFSPRFYVWADQASRALFLGTSLPPLPDEAPLAAVVLLLAVIVLLAAGVAAQAAIIHAADATYRRREVTARTAARRAIACLPAIAGGMVIYYLIGAAIMVVALLPASWLVLQAGALAFAGLVVGVGGFAALVLLGVRVSVLVQVIVLEKLGPLAGFRRSWRLTTGSGWRVLAYTVLVAVLNGLVGFFIGGTPIAVFDLHPEIPHDVAISTMLDGLVDLLTAPVTPLIFTLLYYDLRWHAGESPLPEPEPASVAEQQV